MTLLIHIHQRYSSQKLRPGNALQDRRGIWSINQRAYGWFGLRGIAIAPGFSSWLSMILPRQHDRFFVIAHDCGHRSFAKRRWVNDRHIYFCRR